MNPTTFVAFYFCIDFKYALQTRSAGETRINDILKKLMKNSTDLARYSKKKTSAWGGSTAFRLIFHLKIYCALVKLTQTTCESSFGLKEMGLTKIWHLSDKCSSLNGPCLGMTAINTHWGAEQLTSWCEMTFYRYEEMGSCPLSLNCSKCCGVSSIHIQWEWWKG